MGELEEGRQGGQREGVVGARGATQVGLQGGLLNSVDQRAPEGLVLELVHL